MKVTLKEQLAQFEAGQYLDSDGRVNSSCFVFYDWFCKDSSLQPKADRLFKKVKSFIKKFPVDLDTHYVFFKNNCPMRGPLYDDFRICKIDGDIQYTVVPKCSHSGKAELWGRDTNNEFKQLLEADTYRALVTNK